MTLNKEDLLLPEERYHTNDKHAMWVRKTFTKDASLYTAKVIVATLNKASVENKDDIDFLAAIGRELKDLENIIKEMEDGNSNA